jgi:hypothetical protein
MAGKTGRAFCSALAALDINLFGYRQCVIDLDAEVTNRTLARRRSVTDPTNATGDGAGGRKTRWTEPPSRPCRRDRVRRVRQGSREAKNCSFP